MGMVWLGVVTPIIRSQRMATKYASPNTRMLSPAALAKQKDVGAERHTVGEDINYTTNTMSCSCGEWTGPALDLAPFRAHRRAMNMRPK
jgi:hypothetical protein